MDEYEEERFVIGMLVAQAVLVGLVIGGIWIYTIVS